MTPFKDITKALKPEELKQLHALGIAVADTETTGLKAGENGLTELAAVRAMTIAEIKKMNQGLPKEQRIPIARGADDTIRLIQFHQFVLPQKPQIADLTNDEQVKQAAYAGYNQRFEYAINSKALEVTGTGLVRRKGRGPIDHLTVNGAEVKAVPSIEPIMDAFLAFTENGRKDAYFNAPFDKRFLAPLFVDAIAYRLAKENCHRKKEQAVSALLPGLLNIDYDAPDITAEKREEIIDHIHKRLVREENGQPSIAQKLLPGYYEPARWQCILQAFRVADPNALSYTLDALVEKMAVNKEKRGAHSAIEDVLLSVRGMLKLLATHPEMGTDGLPTMGALPGLVLQRSHGEKARSAPSANGRDVTMEVATARGKEPNAMDRWLASVNEAHPADPLAPGRNLDSPQVFTAFPKPMEVSGKDKRPRFLSLVKNMNTGSNLLERYKWITQLTAHDRPGTFVDVTIDKQVLHDVPWNILRRNAEYLSKQPAEERLKLLKLLRDIEALDPGIGGVTLLERNGQRGIHLYGHVRQFGSVIVPWPKRVGTDEMRQLVTEKLDKITGLGIMPFGIRDEFPQIDTEDPLENEPLADEEGKDSGKGGGRDFFSTQIDLFASPPHFHLELDPRLFQLFKAGLPVEYREQAALDKTIPTKEGRIRVSKEHGKVVLDGPAAAFDTFITEGGTPIAEKPVNLLRDAAWLLYRMEQIPGTSRVEVTPNYRIKLHQEHGITVPTLALLHQVKIPHRASAKEIRFSAGALMQSAFDVSLGLARAQRQRLYAPLMADTSIVPSLVKGLLDGGNKRENQKNLTHVMYHPQLGLDLHYAERGAAKEVIRIPKDKLIGRTLPQGRRRVQRIFARLHHAPIDLADSRSPHATWEVTLTPFELALFEEQMGSKLAKEVPNLKRESDGTATFVITEDALMRKENPVHKGLAHVSDKLASITQLTGMPNWSFQNAPWLENGKVTLRLPQREPFAISAPAVYGDTAKFLNRMQHWTGSSGRASSLSQRVRILIGGKDGQGASPLAALSETLRRDPSASLTVLLNRIDGQRPPLQELHAQCRDLAERIAVQRDVEREDAPTRELGLPFHLQQDRVWVAQIIATTEDCLARAEVKNEAGEIEYWTKLRNGAIRIEDKMVAAINGSERLKEALNTAASRIANGGTHWRKSLIGAMVHARLDTLDGIYLEAIDHGQLPQVGALVEAQRRLLSEYQVLRQDSTRSAQQRWIDQYDEPELEPDADEQLRPARMRIDDTGDAFPALIVQYVENAGLRLLARWAAERDPSQKDRFEKAATTALMEAYGKDRAHVAQTMEWFRRAADPQIDLEHSKQALTSLKPELAEMGWIALLAMGKAKPGDLKDAQQKSVQPEIDASIHAAMRTVGQCHFYRAAKRHADIAKLRARMEKQETPSARTVATLARLEAERATEEAEGFACYRASGASDKTASTYRRTCQRRALDPQSTFMERYAEKEQLLELQKLRGELINFTPKQQERVLKACVSLPGGREELQKFYHDRLPGIGRTLAKAREIRANHPNFTSYREEMHKRTLLRAKSRVFEELDDLGKIEYHARSDLEALMALVHDSAIQYEPRLAATPLKAEHLHRPERFGLEHDLIGELRGAAQKLDLDALTTAKQALWPGASLDEEERTRKRLTVPLALLKNPSPVVQNPGRDTDQLRAAQILELPALDASIFHHDSMGFLMRAQKAVPDALGWLEVQETPGSDAVRITMSAATRPGKFATVLLNQLIAGSHVPKDMAARKDAGRATHYELRKPYTAYAAWSVALAQQLAALPSVAHVAFDSQSNSISIEWKPNGGNAPAQSAALMKTLVEFVCAPEASAASKNMLRKIFKGSRATLKVALPPFPVVGSFTPESVVPKLMLDQLQWGIYPPDKTDNALVGHEKNYAEFLGRIAQQYKIPTGQQRTS